MKANVKNFTLSLIPEETEKAQEELKKAGISLSSFVRSAIHEFLEALEAGQKKKNFKDMSAVEFIEAVEEMKKKLD